MFTFLVVVTALVFIILVLVAAIRPMPGLVSAFELERRVKRASREAKAALRREELLADVVAFRRILEVLLLVIFVLLSVVTFGWLIGIIVAVIIALEYGAIARFRPFQRAGEKLYQSIEPSLLNFVEKAQPVLAFIRTAPQHESGQYRRFDSRQELQRLVDESGDVLSENERKLIVHTLGFKDQTVDSIMTLKGEIATIKKGEFLGPLVLSELHDIGHSRLPVIGSDINHVVGILHLKDLLSLDVKRSVTAEKAMEPKVYYIRSDQSLEHALAAFLRTRHHLFIVINKERETVGLVTLEDVIEALLGRKIRDEDDHENARSVAEAEDEPKNLPDLHIDV